MQRDGSRRIFRLPIDPFGIVAPDAFQGTALEEHGGADSRPVVQRVPLDVEHQSAVHSTSLPTPRRQPAPKLIINGYPVDASSSRSDVMMVAVGFNPRIGSRDDTRRRVSDWLQNKPGAIGQPGCFNRRYATWTHLLLESTG